MKSRFFLFAALVDDFIFLDKAGCNTSEIGDFLNLATSHSNFQLSLQGHNGFQLELSSGQLPDAMLGLSDFLIGGQLSLKKFFFYGRAFVDNLEKPRFSCLWQSDLLGLKNYEHIVSQLMTCKLAGKDKQRRLSTEEILSAFVWAKSRSIAGGSENKILSLL